MLAMVVVMAGMETVAGDGSPGISRLLWVGTALERCDRNRSGAKEKKRRTNLMPIATRLRMKERNVASFIFCIFF